MEVDVTTDSVSRMLAGMVLLIIYLLPAINGYSKKHGSRAMILVVNVLLGWTLIGWVIALAWSAGGENARADIFLSVKESQQVSEPDFER